MIEPIWLSITADVASVVSLVLTAYVWKQTRQIKIAVLRNARLPDAVRDLERTVGELQSLLKNWPISEREIIELLTRTQSVLVILNAKLVGPGKDRVRAPQLLIGRRKNFLFGWKTKSMAAREEQYWEIYNALLGAIEALRQMHADYRKRV